MMTNTAIDSGATPSAPNNPFVTEETFNALLGELYERLGLAEGRADDAERFQRAQDRRIAELLERLAKLEQA